MMSLAVLLSFPSLVLACENVETGGPLGNCADEIIANDQRLLDHLESVGVDVTGLSTRDRPTLLGKTPDELVAIRKYQIIF
jgi:hypothetical protein